MLASASQRSTSAILFDTNDWIWTWRSDASRDETDLYVNYPTIVTLNYTAVNVYIIFSLLVSDSSSTAKDTAVPKLIKN